MNQLFFLEGKLLGQALRTPISADRNSFGLPLSRLFYCAECGEVFAKCPVLLPSGKTTTWSAHFACCRRCESKSSAHVPGSIWHYEYDFVAAFPDAVLQWELDRHLDFYERQSNE